MVTKFLLPQIFKNFKKKKKKKKFLRIQVKSFAFCIKVLVFCIEVSIFEKKKKKKIETVLKHHLSY